MVVRAIKGAITLDVDERTHLLKSTAELLAKMLHANNVETDQLISIVFSTTEDIKSELPSLAVRELGLEDVPVMCFSQMSVAGAAPMVIRILININTDLPRLEIKHVYLRGAESLNMRLAK